MFNVLEQLGESRMVGTRFPIHKRLKRPLREAERDFVLINSDGEIFLLLLGLVGFRLDPLRTDRVLGPNDNRKFRSSKFLSDYCIKRSAYRMLRSHQTDQPRSANTVANCSTHG
jgi:hypothetical protein